MEDISQIDYQKDMTLVALVGDFGFGKVVGVAEYFLNKATGMAEISAAIANGFKRRGLGALLLQKLYEAAQQREIKGFVAYTTPQNKAMIRLFKTLPFDTVVKTEEDLIVLECKFVNRSEPA